MKKFTESIVDIKISRATDDDAPKSISFFSFDDIKEWSAKEIEFLEIHLGVTKAQRDQPYQKIWSQFTYPLKQINAVATELQTTMENEDNIDNIDDGRILGHVTNIRTLASLYSEEKPILSSSPKGKYISQLDDQSIRVHTYAAFSGIQGTNQSFALQGMLEAYRYSYGPEDTLVSIREALEELHAEQTNSLNSLKVEFRERLGHVDKKMREFEDEHEGSLQSTNDTLKSLDAQYREQIATREAVGFWKEKHKKHKYLSWFFAGLVSLWFVAGISFLLTRLGEIADPDGAGVLAGFAEQIEKTSSATPLIIAIAGLLAVIYLWIARLLVRFLLSNSHLATDAAERRVATQVFLALMNDKSSGVEPEDRKFILENIFRPTQLGMIKEESAPPGILGALTRRLDSS